MGPSKQLKQIIQTEHTYKLTLLRIPTGRRQTSWLVTSVTEDLDSGLVRAGLEPGNAGLRVRHADHSAALTPDRYALCVVITFTALVIAEL